MKKINCKECDWSWEIESDDNNPHLCHKCGFDNLKNKFDFEALENWKRNMSNKPYKQIQLESGTIQRTFKLDADDSELTWHRDKEDRLVYLSEDTDWMFQFEDSLPVYMNLDEAIYIPKNTYHRIIKGTDELKVEIIFIDESDIIKEDKKKKGDRCTRIAKRKYDTWPSAYASGAVVKCRKGKIWKNLKEEEIQTELEEVSKTDFSKEKESGLHGWFSRQGAKGKSKGWVDCNTCRKDKQTGKKTCKSCGRKEGEKRAKYPSCRPTPSACGTKGKGDSWGKKSKNESIEYSIDNIKIEEITRKIIRKIISEELKKIQYK